MEDTENAESEAIPKSGDASPSQGKSCALCGCATPAVRCDRCNSQIFCLSCDDMYHRHPKRKLHLRKAVDSIWSTGKSPRLRRRTDLPGDPCKIPIPPPRTKKRERHTIGGRIFLKSGLELGSFGHSKVFDPKNLMPSSKDFFAGQKSPASLGETHLDDDASSQVMRPESAQLYENENVANAGGNVDVNVDDRSPWNATRTNIASPIQVSIPSNSPDIVANGQSFGYPSKPHSQSAADLSVGGHHPGHPPYHHPFHGPYPYVHPAPIPPMHPYSHSMAHLNCAQCLSSSSWSNLMSPHPSPYFHPMPWGSAHNTMTRPPHAGQHLKQHSHGDLASYPDSNFHYPYPGAGYYHNGPPVVDPNFIKDLHEQAEMQKLKKDGPHAKQNPGSGGEEMEVEEPAAEAPSSESRASAPQAVQQAEEEPAPVLPAKPTEPWACVHCTFINPPGIHVCQICCKTSYGNSNKGGEEQEEESGGIRPRSRDSESPLVNRDALLNSPGFADFQEAQKHDQEVQMESPFPDSELSDTKTTSKVPEAVKLTTETQTSTSTKTTDVQTQNVYCKSIASSTDSIFPKQEISVQTEVESATQNFCSVATDPMISSQSMESLLSGVSAPPYHNRRAGWGRGATSFSTQSLYERGRSRSPMPRSLSLYNEAQQQQMLAAGFQSEEAMHSASQAWLYTDPMYYKPHNQGLTKEDYFDGTWGSMDRLNRRVKHKKDKGKVETVRPKFHRSLDDLKSDKRPEMLHTQELMMLQTVKEAERCGFSLEDLHVAYLHCGKENPVYWLEDNWPAMIKNVIALAAKYGEDNEENDVGVITATEAKDALRIHRGDIWDAVTECIENRQRKILELTVRGNFTQKQISDALKHNEGNVELAYADLVRASTRRHKFILSPGLSEDSEDLNLYNPVEEGSTDHHVGHIKLVRTTDISGESKTEKKKSDFLTKLSAIRTAQSERRKAREEKELIRETITQDYEVEVAPKEKDISAPVSMSREDSKEVEENIQDIPVQSPVEQEVEVELKPTTETPEVGKVVSNVKEGTEDSIPIDFDTNWSESQGEWIEEYSDEQWEDDSQWVGLGKKFQKMEKEFEEEAMQMAALWEKEELEDDVFEEEAKELKTEAEVVPDSDRKFDEWVKANLKVDSFEYEDEEAKSKAPKEDITNDSLVDSIELEVGRPSPLQHYPTAHDLSMKSQFESDWVDLPADAEIEKLAHDIVCEGSDIEGKFEEEEMVQYEEEKKMVKLNDLEGSDEDWEKIEMDEQQLQDVNELDQFAFPDKEGDIEKNIEELDQALMENIIDEKESELALDTAEIKIEEDSKVLYKNLDSVAKEDTFEFTSTEEPLSGVPVSDTVEVSPREEPPLSDGDLPRPPVRRKSKLNSAAIEQALKNHAEISADIPPVLPEKTKNKDSQPNVSDLYAMPDRAKVSQEQVNLVSDRSVPQKPPRLNLSPELDTQKGKEEIEPAVPPKTIVSKDASPVTSLSNESDSNCFADSESDTEIKLRRQKNIHRKAPKYENEIEDVEIESISKTKLDKMAFDEEKADIMLESNLDFELDDDIDPALIEPLPPMKSIDFDPELPILLGGRGRGLTDLEDVDAPKAFREDTTRPLQLFKATKRETPTNTLSMSTSGFESIQSQSSFEQQVEETSFIMRTKDELPAHPLELAPSRSMAVSENLQENAAVTQDSSQFPVSSVYENQVSDKFYYNETVMPPQPEVTERLPEKWEAQPFAPDQLISEVGLEKNIEQVEPSPTVEEQEMGLSEMEGMSAAVDYFFGRYNEITVTRPKKKTPARAKPASPSPKPMSASEIAPSTKSEAPSEMEKSAAAVLETKESLQSKQSSDLKASIPHQNLPQKEVQASPVASREIPTSVDKVKEPAPNEYLPFAEDYLFGCYNEVVVVPRKKKTIALAPIPKLGASLTKAQNELKEKKTPVQPVAPPEQPAQSVPEPSPEEPEEELSKEEHAIPSETSSLIYDEVFHDLPADILANQSFDDGGSIYYESFQDAVEEIQDTSSMTGTVNIKAKTVHFEEPAVPVAPPRRNKVQPGQKPKAAASAVSSESYADEYLFRQYEERSQAKKKLPVCSEDFRMKQGFEPTEFPCDTPLLPDEQQEGVISSEISVETPQKTIDSLKNNLEYDFGDSEQSLDSVKHEVIEPGIVDNVIGSEESQIDVSVVKDNSVSGGFSVEATMEVATVVREDNMQRTDLQLSESTGSFEELSLPNQSEEKALTESPAGSSDIYAMEESQIISDDLAIESSLNDMQPPRPSKPKPYDQGSYPSAPPGLEMDQFVFIEQTQDIIDDSYTLYDIQESLQSSLACDLNYVDVKNNIEDECTDDSEKEWKRNEDIKNSLNASFLSSVSSERDFDDQVEAILDISEKLSLEESKDQYPEADKSKKEELNMDEEESKIFVDKNYFEGLESQSDVTEACTSEQSDYVVIDSQMGETMDNQLSAEISQYVTAIESDYESKDSFSVDENDKESEFAKPESLEILTTTEDRDEYSSEISQEAVESAIQPLSVLCQAASEIISDTTKSAAISEDLSITQEDTLEFSEEIIHKTDEEEVSVTEDQQIDILEDLEASGELSDNGNDLSDDSLAPSTHSSVSTQIAVSMKLGLKEPEPDESSLFEFSENLENDNEVSAVISLPSSTVSENVSSGEEAFPLEHISESGDAEVPEFIQTVSTTDNVTKEEYESEIKEFEYGEGIEIDIEQAMAEGDKFTPTPPLESESFTNLDIYSPEMDLDVADSLISQSVEEGPEISDKEPDLIHEKPFKSLISEDSLTESTDRITTEFDSEDILQNSDAENMDKVVVQPSGYSGIYDVYEIKEDIKSIPEDTVDEVIDISSSVSDYSQMKEAETDQSFEHSECILSEDMQLSNTEMKLSKPDSVEATTDSLFDEENIEEPSLSIMSHFYDEWYHNVQPSTQFTLLSTDSIYAKYGAAESSESGNESGDDNVVVCFKPPEDIMQEDKLPTTENLVNQIVSRDQDVNIISMDLSDVEKDNFMDEIQLQNTTDKSDFDNISNQTELLPEENKESKQEWMKDQEIFEEPKSINDFMSYDKELTETVTFISENQESILSEEQSTSETKLVESKFSTSKSCQTEDSFEEDIFFDSFDDTFTIPSYIHLPIEVQTKPEMSDISVQCEIISSEAIIAKETSITTEIQATAVVNEATETQDFPDHPKQSEEIVKEPSDESSCESFEESDSDFFIESHSSHDELEIPSGKKGPLYAEIDSDTGFSSGSESGWIQRREKHLKGKKTPGTDVQLQEISSMTMSVGKEAGSVQTYVVTQEKSIVKSQVAETLTISEKSVISESDKGEQEPEDSDAKVCPFPPEIIERAVTPVAVPQFPSFEEDLVFVEVEEHIEEVPQEAREEVVSTTPTVEYFYGALPGTVKIESPPDLNERFFETASELSESLSFPLDSTESFSDSSVTFSEKIPKVVDVANKETEMLEEESFADTCSSFRVEDSISEYYALPESITSRSERENLTKTESSEVSSDKVLADFTKVTCDKDIKTEDVQVDNTSQETKSLDIAENKEDMANKNLDAVVISSESELGTEMMHNILSKKETLSEEVTVSVESQETAGEENVEITDVKVPVDSELSVSADGSKSQAPASDVGLSEYEAVEPLKLSADVPPVPSDIVRYLYYDDSITFDDDSYHTQSEILEAPPLPADEPQAIASDLCETAVAKDSEILQDSVSLEKLTDKVCSTPMEPEKQLEDNLISGSTQKFVSKEEDFQESPEFQKMPEESIPEEVCVPPVSELKLATVEIISAEDVSELSSRQVAESVQNIVSVHEKVSEPEVLSLDTESEDFHPVELKKTSPEVPQVPSDIVRYLYYGDDITFEETTDVTFDDTSFHSQSDALGLPSEDKMTHSDRDVPEISDLDVASADNLEFMEELESSVAKLSELSEDNKMKLLPEMKKDSFEDSSFKHESSSGGDLSLPPLDSSECVEKWFDIEADPSINGKKEIPMDSEQHSSTKSSALKDSEQPCIPEYILSPIPEGNLPATKTDIDEVTDISTHFTMTDDSDKFSDIESDTSLNFEDECILPLEIEPVEIENVVLFESSMDEEDEDINLPTPEVKCLPGGFQFPTPELSGEFVQKSVKLNEPQEEFDECVTSTEFSEQHREQFDECLTSSEVLGQQPSKEGDSSKVAIGFSDDEPKELFESGVSWDVSETKEHFTEPLTSSEQHSKEGMFYDIVQDHTDQEFKEFPECDNLNDISEISKEQFSECLTASEEQGKESASHEVQELMEKMDEQFSLVDVSEHFTECELLSEETGYEVSQESVSQQSKELSYDYAFTDLRDENGNISESLSTVPDVPVSSTKMAIKAEHNEQFEITETELSCYTSPIEETKVESSFPTEADNIQVCTKDFIESSEIKEPEQTALDKDEDIDESCYTAPNEDSVGNEEDSISTEITDNWVDAEGKNIEVDESIYDLPLEEVNLVQSEVSTQDILNLSEKSFFGKSFESIKSDLVLSEVEKVDTFKIETSILPSVDEIKSDITAEAEEISDKFVSFSEDENAIPIAKDTCQISEETSLKMDDYLIAQSEFKEKLDDSAKFVQVLSSEKCFETSSDVNEVLLSSDIKGFQEVKVESESEMKTAVQEEVNIECGSAVSGAEPKFLLGETVYDTQEVGAEEGRSKGLCSDEKVITSSSSVAAEKKDSLEITDTVTKEDAQVSEPQVIPQKENITTDTYKEKEPELVTLTTKSETAELLEVSDDFSAECIAAVTSESAFFENISPTTRKVVYEEPHTQQILKVESKEISVETETESLEKYDVYTKNLAEDTDIQIKIPETSEELETALFKDEVLVDSCKEKTVLLLKESVGVVDKEDVDVDKTLQVFDVDSQISKPETSGELETYNFKEEFSVDTCEKETEFVLKKTDGIVDKKTDVDTDKKSLIIDVDSQLSKPKTPSELETYNFKGEFSVDSSEKEVVISLKESVCFENTETKVDTNKTSLVFDTESQLKESATSVELETVHFESEFSVDSEKETEVVLKKQSNIPDKKTDFETEKALLAVNVDSQLKESTLSESDTADFRGEFSVHSYEKEDVIELKESVCTVDKERDVKTDKEKCVFPVDSQVSESERSGELEIYNFKGEFSVDSLEKETEVVLKKPGGIPVKETFVDSDKKSLIDVDTQLSKPETSSELETYNFKGEFSIDSCKKEPAVEIKEPIDSSTDKDFTSKISDFKMESSGSEISVEVVDFKMISNGIDFKDQIPTYEERISGFIEQPTRNYAQDFDAKTKDISYKIIESPETVDFKGQDVNVDAEKLGIIELSRVTREDRETRFTTDDTHLVSNNQIVLSESVDFKGTLGDISIPTENKEETPFTRQITYKMPPTTQEQNLKTEARDHSPEIVDFRGQIVSTDLGITVEKKDVLSESSNYSKSRDMKEKLSVSEDSNIGLKIGDSHNVVDFKIIGSDELSVRKTEVRDTTVFTEVKDLSKVEETIETVDFKQFISVGDQSSPEEKVTFIQKDIHPVKDTDLLNYEKSEEIADFRGIVSSGVKALESQSDISKEATDTSQLLFKDKTTVVDTLNDVQEEITFQSHGNIYHEENVTTYSVSNETSVAESSELYSCVETLSAVDTSMQFYSLSDDLDDTLNTTSEDFTDVPSHFTSTEDSDKWSDVEGDLSMEDVEFDRDKTPTRTEVKSNVLGEITKTGNIELQTGNIELQADKITKPGSTLQEVSLESYDVNKNIQKETLAKYEENIVDSKVSFTGEVEISEKWSDVESEIHLEDLKIDFKGSNVYDGQSENLDMEQKRDISSETPKESTAEEPLMEHFAAIKSLNESLTVANTFSSFDADTAVSKTHEDSTDISSQFEKTESECWLEVATDNSVSEVAEDVAFSAETEEKLEAFPDKVIEDKVETSISCQFDSEMRRTSTMSTSSSYTDLDNSDQTSDTCADISLQGATTESSDRWSDIEAEALIDDVLYGKTDLIENVESADFVQSIKKLEERKEKDETPLLESQPILLSSVKFTEVCASTTANVASKSESLVKDSSERKSEVLKVTSLSSEGPDSLSINLTESGLSSLPTEASVSSPSNVTTTVMSDDDFTNVTPLDVTTEESDKWSDISGDASIEEIEEDSSVSLKASLKLQESESNAVSSEFKVDVPIKESDSLSVEEKEVLDLRLSDTDSVVKETIIYESTSEKQEILLDLQKQQDIVKVQKEEDVTFNLTETAISQTSTEEVKVDTLSSEMECISVYSGKKESMSGKELASIEEVIQTDASIKLKPEEVSIDNSQLRQHIETEDISESKIIDESESVDTFTDVLTQTLSPETSEAYCELESDHSIEDFETQPQGSIETPSPIQHIVDTSRQTVPECYENSLTLEEMAEEADEYELDAIPENELENYEDEEYSLSEHFEINEDELIYPLPYNDWIEQSFELKEYGIEAAFSESGSDIHGLGIASDIHGLGIADEEYDDEDIQRAIDFNISNFEDEGGNNIETVVTTESFKTLSNDVSPHLKHSDKEFDSWSTADAPSIEEEEEDLAEHDNILSKIDELLAEDFDLGNYQTESPLQHEQDAKDYFFKDISTPEYLHSEDYAEIKESSLPEETLLHIDKESEKTVNSRIISNEELLKKDFKIPDSVTFEKDDKIFKTESVPSEVILKKDSKISEPEYTSEEINLKKDSKISESEAVFSKFSIKKDSKISDSESVSIQFSPKKDSEISESEVSTQFSVKRDFKIPESEAASSQFSLKKDSKISESEAISIQFSVKKDSEKSESDTAFSQFTLKKDSKTAGSETVVTKRCQREDSTALESESLASKIALKKDSELFEPKAETVSSQFSLKKDLKISDSELSESEVSTQFSVKRDFKISESESASSQFSLKKDSKISESEAVSIQFSVKKDSEKSESDTAFSQDSELFEPKAETVSNQFSLKKDSKVSDSESVVTKILQVKDSKALESKVATSETLKKDSQLSDSEIETSKLTLKKDSIVSEHEPVSNQMVLQKDLKISDTETVYSKLPLMKDSKISEPETVSTKVTLDKDSETFHTDAECSKIYLKRDTKVSELETVSGEITLAKDSKTSETISGEISLQSDSKVTESKKISVKQTVNTSTEEVESAAVLCEQETKSKIKASLSSSDESSHLLSSKRETTQVASSSETDTSLLLSSAESKMKQESIQAVSAKVVQSADAETEVSVKLKSGVVDRGKDFTLTTDEASASITLFSKDSQTKDQSAGSIILPATETDSSFDIPSKQLRKSSTASAAECSIKETSKKLSEKTETIQSSQLSDSSKLMLTSESNIPEPKVQDNLSEKSVSETLTIISKEHVSTDSVASEVKPDIPRKVKRRSLDTREVLQIENVEKKPSLPPKLSKRHSTSSSSPSESLSSSSSMESLGSFESAPSERSRKSSLKSSEDTSYHSESPEVPARRSRSSRLSSSSRSRSRDSEDNSSSSLRIRRRSSNFREPEPIDLSKKRASIDERMQKLQNEGKCQTKEKAFIAAKLIEMQFEEEDALLASRQCNTVYHAVKFLTQLCELCNCRFPINLMTSMVHCTHRACKECLKAHFTSLIYDRSIFTLLCPVCRKPDITDQNIQEYFNHLDMMLRNILETKVYDLFQRKLRDEVLTKDPNFHWCSQCSSGFIASPRLKKLYCPDCSAITCALCHQTWELEHEGVHCERFQQWKDMHTPEPPPAGLVKFLVDRGIGCPSCGLLYAQACGGCMMYKCSHCSFEFCGFCIQPLKRGRECSNDVCEMRGLHIHHVHNCLFYLRDLDISEIQMLLEEESVPYLTIPPKDQIVKSRCQVREQKHAHGVITEDRCGRDIEPYCGGLCRTHYYEYLAELLRQNGISPLSMMTIQDLQSMLRKSRVLVPERMKGETSEDYYERLLKLITSTLT